MCPKIQNRKFNLDVLNQTSRLLQINPEYYTIWNHRRLIVRQLLSTYAEKNQPNHDDFKSNNSVSELISDDLDFLIPLLRKFPKCYWIWKYRLWLLDEASSLLSLSDAQTFWQRELDLVGKMLSLDNRNFHGWGYRRKVVTVLESPKLSPTVSSTSRTEEEFKYTTKMIESNLSNFSAWHNRSKLIPRLLNERKADMDARMRLLDSGKDSGLLVR